MATTAGYAKAIEPTSRMGGTVSGGDLITIPMTASAVYQQGDIIIITSGDAVVDNSDPTAIFGVAMVSTTVTANATIDYDAQPGPDTAGTWSALNVAMATPGSRFAGSLIDTGPNNATGVYATDVRIAHEILEDTQGTACLHQGTSAGSPCTYALGYMSPQVSNASTVGAFAYGRKAGVGLLTPRLEFFFLVDTTVFGT